MTFEEFRHSLSQSADPPVGLSEPLQALWWDGRGDWERAHETCQAGDSADHAWVHAYLHRKEGDEGNARYWYSRAGQKPPEGLTLEQEWAGLAAELLG